MGSYYLHGPVPRHHPTLLPRRREVDEIAARIEKADCYVAVLGSRQTGKTTLLYELIATYAGRWDFVCYDLQNWGDLDIPTAYLRLSEEAARKLNLSPGLNTSEIKNGTKFEDFVAELATLTHGSRLVFLVDEPEGLAEETSSQIGSTFRKIFTDKSMVPAHSKVVFVLFSSLDLYRLSAKLNSPLRNVTECVYLNERDFSADAIRRLADVGGMGAHAERVFWWTQGHPYLSQRLCSILEENPALGVDEAADELIHGGDANIEHVLKCSEKYLETLERIWRGEKVKFSRGTPQLRELELIGLIRKDSSSYCMARNEVYRQAAQDLLEAKEQPMPKTDVWRDQKGDVWVRRGDKHSRITMEEFSTKEYAFFNILYNNCGKPCSKATIWEAVWPECIHGGPDPDSIFQVVSRLREIIELDPQTPRYIITVRAIGGYKLVGCA